jgi:Fe-S cluster assembly ATPase SufC
MISIENLHLNIEGKEILKGIGLHLQPGVPLLIISLMIFNQANQRRRKEPRRLSVFSE